MDMKPMHDTGDRERRPDNPDFHTPRVGEDVTELMWIARKAWQVAAVDGDGRGATLVRYAPKRLSPEIGDERYEYTDEYGRPLLRGGVTKRVRFRNNHWYCGRNRVSLAWKYREEYRYPFL